MKKLFFLLMCCLCAIVLEAQNEKRDLYSVAFYNLENLFDTIHDAGKNDYDFLPNGSYKWNSKKYEAKLENMAKVLSSLSRERVPQGPAFIGVAEVENDRVLDDLLKQPSLSAYKYIHYEGPDKRGIDCALLYDPQQFEVTRSKLVFSEPYQGDTVHLTRGFLIVDGRMAGERVCVIVNHWPSRGAQSPVRVHAARQVKALADSLRNEDRKLKLFIMGDMNDDPMDESMQTLGARKYKKDMRGLTREAKNKLLKYAWPGNVRELQHTIERAVILGDGSLLKPENFLFHASPKQRKEEEMILSEGNISRAAEYLGITRFALYRKLEKLGL